MHTRLRTGPCSVSAPPAGDSTTTRLLSSTWNQRAYSICTGRTAGCEHAARHSTAQAASHFDTLRAFFPATRPEGFAGLFIFS